MYYFYMGSELLPIPPEKFSLKIKNANKTLTLINEGEINILKEAGLTDLEFKVLIPAARYPFATYETEYKPPKHYLNYFEELKTSKKPFQLIVSREMPDGKMKFDTNMTVSMESYTVDENSKDVFDLMITIKLKQYREYGTKIVKVSNNIASVEEQREQSNSPAPQQETTYTVAKGDCLWNIAKKIYGDGSLYLAIYEANKDKITQPYLIYPGQTLVIPSITDAPNLAKEASKTPVVPTPTAPATNATPVIVPTKPSADTTNTTIAEAIITIDWTRYDSAYEVEIAYTKNGGRHYRTSPASGLIVLKVDEGTNISITTKEVNSNENYVPLFTIKGRFQYEEREGTLINGTVTNSMDIVFQN